MGNVTEEAFSERAMAFGRSQHLVGVLSMPAAVAAVSPPGIAFISSGIIHRVGANRIYVRLARALARRGSASLRFDLSGIGDSSQPDDQLEVSRAELEQRDIDDALSLMQREGVGPLIVAGLCSGADNSLATIARNEHVSGAVLMDPFVFRTRRYYVEHYGPRLLRPAAWWNALTGQSTAFKDLAGSVVSRFPRSRSTPVGDSSLSASTAPSREEFQERLEALIERGARLLFVFTGGLEERYNYRNQLFDAFPRIALRAHAELEYLPDSDHTFSRQAPQRQLEARIVTWYDTHFGTAAVR